MNDEQAAALRKAFPQSAIGELPKGGTLLPYVGHAAVTDRLLQVDPEWTWEPLATDEFGLPAMDAAGNLWIKLTVCGVTRLGVGDGTTQKIRIGDALRNAAMRFGVALDLWAGKADLDNPDGTGQEAAPHPQRPVSHPAPAPRGGETGELATAQQVKKAVVMMNQLGITEEGPVLEYVNRVTGADPPVKSRKELTKKQASRLIDSLSVEPKPAPTPSPGMDVPGGVDPWQQQETPPEELP